MQAEKSRDERNKKKRAEERIDEAIRETFPASDPTAAGEATSTEPVGRSSDHKPPTISREDVERARKGRGHAQNDSIKRSG